MKLIGAMLITLPLLALGDKVNVSLSMSPEKAVATLKSLGAVDISYAVGRKYLKPAKASFWELRDYDAVFLLLEEEDKLSNISYWAVKDFTPKDRRSDREQTVKAFSVDTETKKISTENSARTSGAAKAKNAKPKYKIDGLFGDWKTYETGWQETGIDWNKVKMTPAFNGIDLKEFYYDNDESYLYLFLICKPSVQERFDRSQSSGALGYFYIDLDMSTNTGSSEKMPFGTDIEIWLPTGFTMVVSDPKSSPTNCFIACEVKGWDAASKDFEKMIRKGDSNDPEPFVAHGKDGVEMALLLSDLGLRKGSKFSLQCLEMESPVDYISGATIQIK